jgi:transposase
MRHYPLRGSPFRAGHDFISTPAIDDIPGVGPALATALVACIADPKAFRSGRNFSAWIGLVLKHASPCDLMIKYWRSAI